MEQSLRRQEILCTREISEIFKTSYSPSRGLDPIWAGKLTHETTGKRSPPDSREISPHAAYRSCSNLVFLVYGRDASGKDILMMLLSSKVEPDSFLNLNTCTLRKEIQRHYQFIPLVSPVPKLHFFLQQEGYQTCFCYGFLGYATSLLFLPCERPTIL